MYNPTLIRSLGRHLLDPPRHPPKIMQHEELIAILHGLTGKAFAIKVTGHFEYEMFLGDFLGGHYAEFELYILHADHIDNCRLDE